MALAALKVSGINSEWLARDVSRYIVRIPTANGSGNFSFKQYGNSANALKAAKKFQRRMLKQYEFDKDFHAKTGDYIAREHLCVTNTTGYNGVYRQVVPNGYQNANIKWCATWGKGVDGIGGCKCFSTADSKIKNEQDAKQKAIAFRKEKQSGKFK